MEVRIPIEIGMPTLRSEILEKANVEVVTKDLDMTDELHENEAVRITSYQQRLINLYNRHVKSCAFRVGDLVLRKVFENTTGLVARKFQLNWKGSYVIVRVGLVGSYALNKLDGACDAPNSAPGIKRGCHFFSCLL